MELSNIKILYVENDRMSSLVLEKILARKFNFDAVENSDEAIEMLKKNIYDLILLDINLGPESMNGLDLMKFIRSIEGYDNTKIFALTTRVFGDEDQKLLDEGFNAFFAKPYDPEDLIRTIDFFFSGK